MRRLFLLSLLALGITARADTNAAPHIRLVLAGDSTMTDKSGWGPGFTNCLAPNIECINLSRGGRSSKSFINEGLWSNCLALKPDYVLVQFGHNDQPGHPGNRETDIHTTYPQYMNQYVDDARAAGIKPVLITSLSRREWGKDDKIHSRLAPWADVVKGIAAEKHVPLIDLHDRSVELYEKLGRDGTQELEPLKNPDASSTNSDTASTGAHDPDHTHLNAKGSQAIGRIVAEELAKAVPELAPFIHADQVGARAGETHPDCVVAADGTGTFTTVQQAVDAAPTNSTKPFIISIQPGTYKGHVSIPLGKPYLTFLGQNATNTIITDDKNIFAVDVNSNKIGTPESSTVLVRAADFKAENVTFENTCGNHGQALALFVDADRAIVRHCRLLGWQDTLRADAPHDNPGRQYYADCDIVGHVDFIYAAATAVFERCHMHCLTNGYVTAASTPEGNRFGYVFLNCRITAEPTATGIYLGRPWRPFARVVYLNTELPAQIRPEGWNNWKNTNNEATAYYAEYHSTGPGARPEARAKWSHQLTDDEAKAYTVTNILAGNDGWDPQAP